MVDLAISKIKSSDEHSINTKYDSWKHVIPLPPDSLMWSVGGQNIENFLVVADAWAQVVSRYTPLDCSVLDIGCGCGRTARMLVNNRYISAYIGFDVIASNVTWCNTFIKPAFGDRYCNFYQFDIYSKEYNPTGAIQGSEFQFPCDDNSVDIVFAASLFTHLLEEDSNHYLRETVRVLKKSGVAIVSIHTDVAPGVNYQGGEARIDIDQEYFICMAKKAGLIPKDVIPNLAGQTALILAVS